MIKIYPWQMELWPKMAGSAPLGHAVLLRGRRGLGKFAFARYLAKSRLCEGPTNGGEACEVCASCRWFEQGSHPDFRLIEPEAIPAKPDMPSSAEDNADHRDVYPQLEGGAETTSGGRGTEPGGAKSKKKVPSKQISVAQIRNVADFINMSTHRNGHKIVLIHPAETMHPAAANALLKGLEEPPALTLFILVSHHPQHLLPTIRSRCRQIAMPVPAPLAAAAWLKQQGVINPEMCLASAGYAPLAALEFNDAAYLERNLSFIRQISVPGSLSPIRLAEEMQKSDLPSVVGWLQKWCYDLLSFHTTGKIRYHLDMLDSIKPVATKIDPRSLTAYLRALAETQQLANHPLNPRLFLEEMLFSYLMALSAISPERDRRIG